MTHLRNTMLHFYQQIGRLFYAVANIDNRIKEEEIAEVKKIILSDWLPIENSADEFGSDAAYQIDSVFDWLRENPIDSHLVIEAFKKYKNENQKLFTPQICNLILKSADKIANSFSGKNKSELIFITQLHTILLKK